MKRDQMVPGNLYAWRDGHSVRPVILVDNRPWAYSGQQQWLVPYRREQARPGKSSGTRGIGFPVVVGNSGSSNEKALELLARHKFVRPEYEDGGMDQIVATLTWGLRTNFANNTMIIGPWEEFQAEEKIAREEEARLRRQREERENEQKDRLDTLRGRLDRLGVKVTRDLRSSGLDLIISADDLAKLLDQIPEGARVSGKDEAQS